MNTDKHRFCVSYSTYACFDRRGRSCTNWVLGVETPILCVGAPVARGSGVDEQTERPFPHSDITERVIAAFYAVNRELGYGFSENVYRRATAVVLRQDGLETIEELITVTFREKLIGTFYADLVVAGVVLVEVKAAPAIENYAQAQILNYLKAAGGGVGLLLNLAVRSASDCS